MEIQESVIKLSDKYDINYKKNYAIVTIVYTSVQNYNKI